MPGKAAGTEAVGGKNRSRRPWRGLLPACVLAALLWLLCLACAWPPALAQSADGPAEGTRPQALDGDRAERQIWDMVDSGDLTSFLEHLDDQFSTEETGFRFSELWQDLKDGDFSGGFSRMFDALGQLLWGELFSQARFIWQIVALSLLCALMAALKNSLGGSVGKIGSFVAYLLVLAPVTALFSRTLAQAGATVDRIGDFVCVMLPVLLPLLAALGGGAAAAAVDPLLTAALSMNLLLIQKVVYPLIFFSAILSLLSRFSPSLSVDKLAGLLKDTAMSLFSLSTALFCGVLGVSGFAAASVGGLSVKAAKTAAGIFIPVVGGTLADTLDSVLAGLGMLKNWLGVVAAGVLVVLCALPALRILLQSWLFKLAGAVAQPLGDAILADSLTCVGKYLTLVFAVLAVSGLFAFFLIVLLVALGNVSLMMR
ncbi:MAG: stage III sporulation protein AE [Firmicutes bacterium]|nr:stage III sporulation protein AE [Bacillota bacterium]